MDQKCSLLNFIFQKSSADQQEVKNDNFFAYKGMKKTSQKEDT